MARRKVRAKKCAFRGRLRVATKAFLIRPAGSCCQLCGYDKYIGNLSFHHKNPDLKSFNISLRILTFSLEKLIHEASKCIVACHNCHGEIHAGLIKNERVEAIPVLNFDRYRLPADIVKWYKKRMK